MAGGGDGAAQLSGTRHSSRVVLARHGKPDWDSTTWIPGRDLGEWSRGRDAAPIDPAHQPSGQLRRIAASAHGLIASPLRRSLESAHLLSPKAIPLVDSVFREVELPTDIRSGLPLPPQVWVKLARTGWYAGWSPGAESYEDAKRRAALAAETLAELVPDHGCLLVVGHGIFNGLIGAELRGEGWEGPRFRPRRLWAFGVYTLASGS